MINYKLVLLFAVCYYRIKQDFRVKTKKKKKLKKSLINTSIVFAHRDKHSWIEVFADQCKCAVSQTEYRLCALSIDVQECFISISSSVTVWGGADKSPSYVSVDISFNNRLTTIGLPLELAVFAVRGPWHYSVICFLILFYLRNAIINEINYLSLFLNSY